MNILYLSVLASPEALHEAEEKDHSFSAYAVQKFHYLLARGFVGNGAKVNALSTFFLPKVGKAYYRRSEDCEGVSYHYIPTLNSPLFRHLWLIFYCFFKVLFFGCFNRKKKVLICDVLNVSACIGAVTAARLIGLRRIGLVTDLPEYVVGGNSNNWQGGRKNGLSARINMSTMRNFTHYVFLTKQMDSIINVKKRPYIVMEGVVDSGFKVETSGGAGSGKIVLYAGGLDEKYGLRLLVEGFLHAKVADSELHVYGDGPFSAQMKEYDCLYPNVFYMGIQPNGIIVKKEQEATLLVNPRPTTEAFTKFSFPSKNMEYMLSGTPVLTTKLPGMPEEYYPYVFLFEDETVSGYAVKIHEVLCKPEDELRNKGQDARRWVFEQKNNIIQTKRIIELSSM